MSADLSLARIIWTADMGSANAPSPIMVVACAPDGEQILAGVGTTHGDTVITVPAGKMWRGQFLLSIGMLNAAGINPARNGYVTVTVSGAGAGPSGVIARVDCCVPQTLVTSIMGAGNANSGIMTATIWGGSAPAVVTMQAVNATVQSVSANGVLY